jgi:hypothetical protein
MKPKLPTVDDLKPTFVGYLGVVKFYHRKYHTKVGHQVISPNGIGEILEIVPPEITGNKYHQYLVRLFDGVKGFFYENQLKYLVVYPTDFYDNRLPILLSFEHYPYANPSGVKTGIYTFKLTGHGYAKMTDKTLDLLKINKILECKVVDMY